MSDMMEVLFTCAAGENQSSCTAWDFRTGTNLMSYKVTGGSGNSLQQHTLNILRAEYVLAANNAKPLLHVWSINSQEQMSSVRFVTPGRVNAMAISPDGNFMVAAVQESLYIWHLTTGHMLNTISKHYQSINCIRFIDDGMHFVSAGQDGGVLVWNLTQVTTQNDDNQTPLYSFTDHGLAVTDVHIGVGGMRAYMMTVSLDRTCKIYDLSNGTLLLSVVFAEGLQSVIANAMETCVYVGTSEGNIYEIHIDAAPRTKEYHIENEHTNRFNGHKTGTAVNCLALSLDGQTLVSGAQDEQVCIWHIPSRQLLKVMPHKGAITNLNIRLTNPAIFHPEHKQPHLFCGNLQRMINPASDDEVIEILVTDQEAEAMEPMPARNTVSKTTAQHCAVNVVKAISNDNDANMEELEKLRAEVQQLRRVNKKLFEVSTKQLLRGKK